MKRREFLRITSQAGFLAAWSAWAKPMATAQGQDSKTPNVVFIIADDMGWNDVGYNNPSMITPHIDQLAKEGVTFTHHYATPTCTPTRVGILTGQYPSRFGVTGPDYGKIFRDDTLTLANAIRDEGYHTAISGKWHVGSPPKWTPTRYGFESSYGYFHGQIDPYSHLYKTGVKSWHRNDEYIFELGHATDLISDEAVRVIEEKQDEPFFLYVSYSVPHYPLSEPEKWESLYSDVESESRRWYNASISHMDQGIGQIVEALDRTGQREDTLIVFVSDNGGQKGWSNDQQYHGQYADKPHTVLGDNAPLRGWKGQVYEGGIRVPGLINWKGKLKPRTFDMPIHCVDWMPTLCSLCGGEEKLKEWDGINFWPYLKKEKDEFPSRSMYWNTGGMLAVRQHGWKLIQNRNGDRVELYHIEKDPHEKKDLADEKPEKVQELKQLLQEIQKRDRDKL